MTLRSHITGWGKYVPPNVLTNDDLTHMVDTSDEWIRTRTGIEERRIADDDETTSSMAIQAAQEALEVADLKPSDLDLIVVATVTPDHPFPATACLVQDTLGARGAAAFDISAGCTGFIYALTLAHHTLQSGAYENALVIGAETLSRITDWNDRSTCVLFGDGAGAVILQADEAEGGVLSTTLGTDGSGARLLYVPAGGSQIPSSHESVAERQHYLRMRGREVFRFAARIMPTATRDVLEKADLTLEDLKLIIPHQANQRIIDSSAKLLDLPSETIFSNLSAYGNTSAASIPIALCEAVEEGRIQRDDLVVCVGFGAGLTWGATAIRWSTPRPEAPPSSVEKFWHSLRYRYAAARSLLRRFVRWLLSLGVNE